MKVFVFHEGSRIGQATLDRLDPPMCIAGGQFEPEPTYGELENILQAYFDLSTASPPAEKQALENAKKKAFKLRLYATTTDGVPIEQAPAGSYIEDASHQLGPNARMIWIAFDDPDFFFECFKGRLEEKS